MSVGNVTIGVFGLFHPREFTVTALNNAALILHADDKQVVLERSSGVSSATIGLSHDRVVVSAGTHVLRPRRITLMGRKNQPVDFDLAVPKRITRRYHGTLAINKVGLNLVAIVTMDREAAPWVPIRNR